MRQAEQDILEKRTQTNRISQRRVNIALVCFLVMVSLLLVALFNAALQEIAQQQAAERQRHAADQKIANVLENMSEGFYAIDQQWIVTYMNDQAEQILHCTRAETLGKSFWEIYPDAVDTEFGEQYRRARDEQVPVRFEAYYPAHAVWYEVSASPNEDGLAIFFSNVTERRKADEEQEQRERQAMLHAAAQRRNQELQQLARRLVEIQEAERGHLAYELHEEVGQVLAGLKLSLAGMLKQPEEMRVKQIHGAQELVTELMRQVRTLSLDLRPGVLDDLGLLPALEWYCRHYSEQTEVAVDFAAQGLDRRLDGTVETTAYRIVQEALANVALHSEVEAVEVRLALEEDFLLVRIVDHGIGLTLDNANCFCDHTSLTGMQERATLIGGVFEVTTGPDQGTTVVARLPIHPVYTSLVS